MSVHVVSWAWRQKAGSAGAKLVLIKLADNADDDGYSWWRQRRLAEECEMSRATVQRKIDELVSLGLLAVEERARDDGGRSSNGYRLQIEAPPPQNEAPPASRVRHHEPSVEPSLSVEAEGTRALTAEEPSLPTRARERTLLKVDRKPVSEDEHWMSEHILGHWNILTKQDLTSDEWLRKIVLRVREHPELTSNDHYRIIHAALADPWWSGHPSPAVIYGNGAVFEQALTLARNGPAPPKPTNGTMRYGRGMTTAQILEATRGLK